MPPAAESGPPDVEALAEIASTVATEAGALLLDGLRRARTSVLTKTSLTDMVTDMDHESEALIVGILEELRPGDGIVGEEGTATASTTGVRWIIDPLDGTTNYLYGLPVFAVSIAAEVDGHVVAGAVRHPSVDETFTAAAGRGAWLDGEPLRIGDAVPLGAALVGTGFSYRSDERARQGEIAAALLPRVRDVRRAGAAAIDLCWVGAGRLDAFFEIGLQVWDWAAGALVAAEAGARVTAVDGGPVSVAGGTLAAAPALHDELGAVLAELTTRAGGGSPGP